MKTITLILLLLFIPLYKNFGCVLVFESEKVFIKVDTASFYNAIASWLTNEQIVQIKSEISRRYTIFKTEEIQMDKMSLQIFNDSIRRSHYSIFFEDDIFKLINSGKANVYYKDNLIEIISWNKQKSRPKKGEKELLYIDNTNNEIFLKKCLNHKTNFKLSNRRTCSGPPIFYKAEKGRKCRL